MTQTINYIVHDAYNKSTGKGLKPDDLWIEMKKTDHTIMVAETYRNDSKNVMRKKHFCFATQEKCNAFLNESECTRLWFNSKHDAPIMLHIDFDMAMESDLKTAAPTKLFRSLLETTLLKGHVTGVAKRLTRKSKPKFSRRVFTDLVFETTAHLKKYMQEFKTKHSPMFGDKENDIIDLSIYGKNRLYPVVGRNVKTERAMKWDKDWAHLEGKFVACNPNHTEGGTKVTVTLPLAKPCKKPSLSISMLVEKTEGEPVDKNELSQAARAIEHKYVDQRDTWLKIVWALASAGMKELSREISSKSSKYVQAEHDAKYSEYNATCGVTVSSIFHFAKLSGWSPATQSPRPQTCAFTKLISSDSDDCSKSSDSPVDTDSDDSEGEAQCETDLINNDFTTGLLTDYFVELYRDKFLHNNKTLYTWNGTYWKKDDSDYSSLSMFVDQEFAKQLHCYGAEQYKRHYGDERMLERVKKFQRKAPSVRKNGFRKGLVNDICMRVTDDFVEFNTNHYDFVFENAVFDLSTRQMKGANPLDYNNRSCGYKFEVCDEKIERELGAIIDTIFPKMHMKDHYMEILATGLCGDLIEKCFIANGAGGNGKGVLNTLCLKTMGGYGDKLAPAVLLKEIGEGANPAVANLDGCRFVLSSEPQANKSINGCTLKALTGDGDIKARGLYSSNTNVKLNLTLVLEANTIPRIDEVDRAIKRRMDITEFSQTTVTQNEYDESDLDTRSHLIVANPYYKTAAFHKKYRMAMFHVLSNYFAEFHKRGCVLSVPPAEVEEMNKRYMVDSDDVFAWICEHYKKDAKCMVKLSDIKDLALDCRSELENMTKASRQALASKKKLKEALLKNPYSAKYVKLRDQSFLGIKITSPTLCGWSEIEEDLVGDG